MRSTWIAIALQLVITSNRPPLSPQQAADILKANGSQQNVANRPNLPPGPRVTFIFSDEKSGPYGSFPPPPVWRPLNCCSTYTTYTNVIGIGRVHP